MKCANNCPVKAIDEHGHNVDGLIDGLVTAAGFEPVTKIDRVCYSRRKMKHEIGGIDYDFYHSSIYRCLHCCVDA